MACESCPSTAAEAQQASLQSQIQYALLAKQLQAQRQQGQAVLALLETSVSLSKEVGKGGQFDGQA